MVRRTALVVVVASLASVCSPLAAEDYFARPGAVPHTLSLPDDAEVLLDNVVVELAIGSYLFVRDPWTPPSGPLLPVYANACVDRWSYLDVEGVTTTLSGKRIVRATRLRRNVDFRGRPMMLPKGTHQPFEWPYKQDVPLGMSLLSLPPAPPEPTPPPGNPQPLTATPGTIAYLKLNGGEDITLEGKVVSAVFRPVGQLKMAFFYIQEPDFPSGIRVEVSECSTLIEEVDAGDVVTVEGDFIASSGSGECYIDAETVTRTGSAAVPRPLALTNRSAAAAAFGFQPALYRDSSDPSSVGCGLSAVGLKVTVWGKITRVEGPVAGIGNIVHYIDDGSGLKRNLPAGPRRGIKVISYQGYSVPTYNAGDYVSATGVLGAEMSSDDPGRPVPVLWMPGPDAREHVWVRRGGSIQAAIEWANSRTPKAEVWVEAGEYHENIVIHDGVAVYGGFFGDEEKREQRIWLDNPCIIDGEVNGLRQRVVRFDRYATASARVDGFVLRNGEAIHGGGVYSIDASPCIANNTITGNSSGVGEGAGVWCEEGSASIWSNCIVANGENMGAGIGGGVACSGGVPAILFNEVNGNWAQQRGGGISCEGTSAGIWGNLVIANTCLSYGGGVVCQGGYPVIGQNKILGNVAGFAGGGIWCSGTDALVWGNTISSNNGAECGGGIGLNYGASATIVNNLFIDNVAADYVGGGAIGVQDGSARIANNTFVGNDASLTPGGAVLVTAGTYTELVNNIFYYNTAAVGHAVARSGQPPCLVSHCDAYPPSGAYHNVTPGVGCVTDDPLFCGTFERPYWLHSQSPVRDIGLSPAHDNSVPVADIESRPRPGDDTTDMGAYEDNPPCPDE